MVELVYYQCKTAPGLFRTVASSAIDGSYVRNIMWLQSTVKLCDKCTRTIDGSRHRRTGRGGGQLPPQFGEFVDMNSGRVEIIWAKHNTCLNNPNLGSVTAVNGKNPNLGSVTAANGKNSEFERIWIPENSCYYPPPTEYGSRKISPTIPPPPNKTLSAPPNGCWPVRLWFTPKCHRNVRLCCWQDKHIGKIYKIKK